RRFHRAGVRQGGGRFPRAAYGATRSLLCTETRTATTDPVSARRFRRYWAVIRPFAGLHHAALAVAGQAARRTPLLASRLGRGRPSRRGRSVWALRDHLGDH